MTKYSDREEYLRSAKDHQTPGISDPLDVIALTPNPPSKPLKIRRLVPLRAIFADEGERLAGEGLRADHFACFAGAFDRDWTYLCGIEDLDGHAEAFGLDFAGVEGEEGCAAHDWGSFC